MADKVVVIFRRWKIGRGVIALFPEIQADHRGNCQAYEHVGQHGAAHYARVIAATVPAVEPEYRDLAAELRQIGYELDIRKRYLKGAAPCPKV